ncbi:MAG: substrate-binding domain-containing protein [Betaproteobacteria bacterium]|nr:substrate-binding domain-containing protein [Betaproteobacteria bacterium]
MKQVLGIVVSLLLLGAVVAGGYLSYRDKQLTTPTLSQAAQQAIPANKVRLLTGSAKFAFLRDPALTAILAKEGIALDLTKSGAFANDVAKVEEFDAIWPAGINAANDFAAAFKGRASTYPVFSTPLAIASWKALLPVLEKNGLAQASGPNHGDFLLDKALPLMLAAKRWNQLAGNEVFNVNKGLLINTPDLRKSNTGALYIAALAYIKNGNEVPQTLEKSATLALELAPLITRQGYQEETLAGPFEDYIGQGMGKAPLVLIYESQFVEAKRDGRLRPEHILLYPQPGMLLKHVLVAANPAGKRLGELLAQNPEIQKIAAKYGFRTNNPDIFTTEMQGLGLDAPALLNLVDTPSSALFDNMTQTIIKKLEGN